MEPKRAEMALDRFLTHTVVKPSSAYLSATRCAGVYVLTPWQTSAAMQPNCCAVRSQATCLSGVRQLLGMMQWACWRKRHLHVLSPPTRPVPVADAAHSGVLLSASRQSDDAVLLHTVLVNAFVPGGVYLCHDRR